MRLTIKQALFQQKIVCISDEAFAMLILPSENPLLGIKLQKN